MRWAIVAAVTLLVAAAIAANALLLLSYGTQHTDPVGTLSPVAALPAPVPTRVTKTPTDSHGHAGRGADD